MAKFESVWTLQRATNVPMNESERLTHYMTVSAITFRHNLCLPTAPAHAQARGVRPYRHYLPVCHRVSRYELTMSDQTRPVLFVAGSPVLVIDSRSEAGSGTPGNTTNVL